MEKDVVKTAKGLLQAVKHVLRTEERWTQGAFARDALGLDCSTFDTNACKWCLVGAIELVVGSEEYGAEVVSSAQDRLYDAIKSLRISGLVYGTLDDFNDTWDYDHVIEALDRAILRA